jgi:hypothetical protein
MTTYRNGKIAHLPRSIRDELNHRLNNNVERGPKTLDWLNTNPDVQKILADQFKGCAITQQNLSEWRRGGFQEWLELQEKRNLTLQMFEHAETLDADFNPQKIHAAFATIAATDFVHTARAKLKETTDTDQRLEYLKDIQLHLSRLRRDDYRAGHLKLRQDRWDHQVAAQKRADKSAAAAEERRRMLAYFKLQPELREETKKRGGSVQARDLSALILELEHNLKVGFLDRHSQEFALTEKELEALKPYHQNMRTTVQVPSASAPRPETPDARPNSAQTPDTKPNSAPIALANDCTPEEFAAHSHPQTRDARPQTQPHPSRCRSSSAVIAADHRKMGQNQVERTGTNP